LFPAVCLAIHLFCYRVWGRKVPCVTATWYACWGDRLFLWNLMIFISSFFRRCSAITRTCCLVSQIICTAFSFISSDSLLCLRVSFSILVFDCYVATVSLHCFWTTLPSFIALRWLYFCVIWVRVVIYFYLWVFCWCPADESCLALRACRRWAVILLVLGHRFSPCSMRVGFIVSWFWWWVMSGPGGGPGWCRCIDLIFIISIGGFRLF
jgi:hypothetical protein